MTSMSPRRLHFASSGDVLADRRYDFAIGLIERGEAAGAVDVLTQALDLAPRWPAALLALGEAYGMCGDIENAINTYEKALAADPQDCLGAAPRLAKLSGQTPENLPTAHLTALFDQYAARFDESLRRDLAYRAPELIEEALLQLQPERTYRTMLDLGCGTGLMARAMARKVQAIDGIDLSSEMITLARKTGLYRDLVQGELLAWLEGGPRDAPVLSTGGYDLIIAADVFVYLGALAPVLHALHRCLQQDGLVAFTLQSHEGEGYKLGEDYRFAHASAHIRQLAAECDYDILVHAEASTRLDRGLPVPGFVSVWTKR